MILFHPGAESAADVASAETGWVGVWGAPPAQPTGPTVRMQTVRQVVRLSLGGRALRLRLSNELGSNPVAIDSVHVARPGKSLGSIDPSTDRVLTFGGQRSLIIQPGMPLLSDQMAGRILLQRFSFEHGSQHRLAGSAWGLRHDQRLSTATAHHHSPECRFRRALVQYNFAIEGHRRSPAILLHLGAEQLRIRGDQRDRRRHRGGDALL